jgi:hypothetical protein
MQPTDRKPFEERLRDATTHIEEDLRRVAAYINDEVVPEVRRNGSEALRVASAELRKLAERIDAANRSAPPPPPPPAT